MRVNRYAPHLLVLPEDEANAQIARGFQLHVSVNARTLQILNEAGGWLRVLEQFESEHTTEMKRWSNRFLVLLFDINEDTYRRPTVEAKIPADLKDRVFLLGVWSEPERLKRDLGSFEEIGEALAEDCFRSTSSNWSHELLEHNKGELVRMRDQVRPFLFEV